MDDPARREELRVEVPRREAKRAAAVALDDDRDVIGSEPPLGPAHARSSVVVGRDRERPVAKRLVVVAQQLGRRARRPDRVEALVDDVVDRHVAPACRAHELPDARRSVLRIGTEVERRLDVRQVREVFRKAEVAEDRAHLVFVPARRDQPVAELVALAQLEADALRGCPQLLGRGRAPEI